MSSGTRVRPRNQPSVSPSVGRDLCDSRTCAGITQVTFTGNQFAESLETAVLGVEEKAPDSIASPPEPLLGTQNPRESKWAAGPQAQPVSIVCLTHTPPCPQPVEVLRLDQRSVALPSKPSLDALLASPGKMRQLKGKPKKETSKDKKERKQAMQEARQQITTVVLPTLAVVVLLIVVFVYVATRPAVTE
ncbi:single-pass membrane and coiled-coil domain-containing protein 4 isoform X1 [Suricata suricatta]|nr:single-pass membrane and coiled-coil domain-containing protein 4 isoform X1 [Suricata suricatta]